MKDPTVSSSPGKSGSSNARHRTEMRRGVVGVPDPLEQLPRVTARFMEALLANQLAMAPAGHRQREVGGRAVLENAVAVDPALLDVLRVVVDDEDIHVSQQLEVAEVREEVRLHHGRPSVPVSPPRHRRPSPCATAAPIRSTARSSRSTAKGSPSRRGASSSVTGSGSARATCVVRMCLQASAVPEPVGNARSPRGLRRRRSPRAAFSPGTARRSRRPQARRRGGPPGRACRSVSRYRSRTRAVASCLASHSSSSASPTAA